MGRESSEMGGFRPFLLFFQTVEGGVNDRDCDSEATGLGSVITTAPPT
jgi:hypothetical protein